jgi:hypothetical protein
MLIIVILSGFTIGWMIGNYLLDRWINKGMEDSNREDDLEIDK